MQRGRDLSTLSNAYLKALITERGYSHDGLLTREELVARAEEAATTPDLPPLEGDDTVVIHSTNKLQISISTTL